MILTKHFIIFIIASQIMLSRGCLQILNRSGEISKGFNQYIYQRQLLTFCWEIEVPIGAFANLTLKQFDGFSDCEKESIHIRIDETNKKYRLCGENRIFQNSNAFDSIRITQTIHNEKSHFYYNRYQSSFSISFEIRDTLCLRKDSFRCSYFKCITKDKVCDGSDDCDDGLDEDDCERGVFTIPGINESRRYAIDTMRNFTLNENWRKNIYRYVTALYLAEFNSTQFTLKDELIATKMELAAALAISRNETGVQSPNELGIIVNGLLMICRNPRNFYGFDLIKLLNELLEIHHDTAHHMAYLALCNANESLSPNAMEKLIEILSSEKEYLFVRDMQAIAVMVVSCMNNSNRYHFTNDSLLFIHYNEAIERFKELQNADGTFGNFHTTAFITQALLSSGEETSRNWNLDSAVQYLMGELEIPFSSDLALSQILPILNGKTLADIGKYNCSRNIQKYFTDETDVENIKNKLGSQMKVQYSLYIGDKKDPVHTISIRVPANITAYEVMKLAEAIDCRYKFNWKQVKEKMYVYEIYSIKNDSELGKFWILYLKDKKSDVAIPYYNEGPDEIEIHDDEHLIMWYKSAQVKPES